jgi:hypothetical protein
MAKKRTTEDKERLSLLLSTLKLQSQVDKEMELLKEKIKTDFSSLEQKIRSKSEKV